MCKPKNLTSLNTFTFTYLFRLLEARSAPLNEFITYIKQCKQCIHERPIYVFMVRRGMEGNIRSIGSKYSYI